HFHRSGDGWVVGDPLRRLVQFQTANLMSPISGKGLFDLILCRNVMIYFDEPTRVGVSRDLHGSLRGQGWLTLGSAESLPAAVNGFESVKFERAYLYQKSNGSR